MGVLVGISMQNKVRNHYKERLEKSSHEKIFKIQGKY